MKTNNGNLFEMSSYEVANKNVVVEVHWDPIGILVYSGNSHTRKSILVL